MASGSLWWTGTSPEALTSGKSFDSSAGVTQAPPRVLRSVLTHRFIRVACGGAHALALTRDGRLFAWGWNDHGQLGLSDPKVKAPAPRPLGYFTGRVVGAIACGAAHSMALVAANPDHFEQGTQCYTWGAHAAGQLGLPAKMLDAKSNTRGIALNTAHPQEVEVVRNLPGTITHHGGCPVGAIRDSHGLAQPQPLACGAAHTAMLTRDGQLYTWGSNEHGQCGREGVTTAVTPGPVHVLTTHKLVAVACGGAHTLALTDQGRLYGFGLNATGQLGNGTHNTDANPQPALVRLSAGIVVSAIACGEEFSAAVTHDGRLLTWGFGGCGQLGHGSTISLRLPRQVQCEPVSEVACGMGHTLAKTVRGGLVQFGYTGNWNRLASKPEAQRQAECQCMPKPIDLSHEAYMAHSVDDEGEEGVEEDIPAAPLHASDIAAGAPLSLALADAAATAPLRRRRAACMHRHHPLPPPASPPSQALPSALVVHLGSSAPQLPSPYPAPFHTSARRPPPPGRSFHLFVGAAVAPMADDDAAIVIQHRFRNYELGKETTHRRQSEVRIALMLSLHL